jgi:hypothetical protein
LNWSPDALFAKSVVYMDRAFNEVSRDHPLFPFWATLGLELLARCAVANLHPALLADPGEAGDNLFYAFGYEVKSPKSIAARTVFVRCQKIVANFTEAEFKDCIALVHLRNEEVHTGGLPFEAFPTEAWLPGFFRACEILLASLAKTLDDLVGPEEAAAARQMLVEVDQQLQNQIKERVGRAANEFAALDEPEKEDRRAHAKRLSSWTSVPSNKQRRPCPACGSTAIVTGEEIKLGEAKLIEGTIVQEHVLLATQFECSACNLALQDHRELQAAGMGGQFSTEEQFDPLDYYREQFDEAYYEPDYGND